MTDARATSETRGPTRRRFLKMAGSLGVGGALGLAGYGQGAMALAGLDFHAKLRSFEGPVLLLNGAADRLNPDAAERIAPSLSGAETRVRSDTGHTCSIERPDEYTSIIREFATEDVWNPDTKQGARSEAL